MKLLIDADGCPVVRAAVDIAKKYKIACVVVSDTAHVFNLSYAAVITVSQGSDSADYKIANMAEKQDIVVTQDYGLAAMCLSKCAVVLDQNGRLYDAQNIEGLLQARHTSKKIRMAGGRTKGPAKRQKQQDIAFAAALERLLKTQQSPII